MARFYKITLNDLIERGYSLLIISTVYRLLAFTMALTLIFGYLTLSLHFIPCLQSVQSAVYPQSVFYSLSTDCIVCSLLSVLILQLLSIACTVCSLPSVCILALVYSLYSLQFTLSLHFTPCLQSVQSVVYPQSAFYSLSTVCIVCSLPSVCILLRVYSLYSLQFTLSLYFTPCLQSVQSVVYPQYAFYPLSIVCIVCSLPSQ